MFPQAGNRILLFSIFSDNTQGNVSQKKKKEVISNLIKQTVFQEKGPVLSSFHMPRCPQTYFVDF